MDDKLWQGTGFVMFTLLSGKLYAASAGNPEQDDIQGAASVCMKIGAMARISGLDDIQMQVLKDDTGEGFVYFGSDDFRLEANTSVRIIVEGGSLINDDYSLNPVYSIDGLPGGYQSPPASVHDGTHTLAARMELSSISQQKSGDYSGQLRLTIVPEMSDQNCD